MSSSLQRRMDKYLDARISSGLTPEEFQRLLDTANRPLQSDSTDLGRFDNCKQRAARSEIFSLPGGRELLF